jgi:hypothetical protein
MSIWPFPVQDIYIPERCNARQIESLTKARIIHSNIYIGSDSPYLYVSTYTHLSAQDTSLHNKPAGKWLPMPEKYNIPCYLSDDIKDHQFLLIPSGKPLLYWRCKNRDFLHYILSSGAKPQSIQSVG